MKIGTTEKLKFKNLQRRLKLPLWQAVGLLETIWKVAYRNAPAGDIGRLPNDEIAAAIEWAGDADELVKVLVETRWFDADPVHRLLVHDWEEECEGWLRANFERYKKQFAKPTHIKPPDDEGQDTKQLAVQTTVQPTSSASLPFHTIPSPTPPLPSACADLASATWEGVEGILRDEGLGIYAQVVSECRSRNNGAAEAMFVVNQYLEFKPAFGVALLGSKLRNMRDGKATAWPPVPEEILKAQRRDRDGQSAAAVAERQKQDRAEAARSEAAEEEKLTRLESAYGERLNKMPRAQLKSFIEKELPAESKALLPLLPTRGAPKSRLLRTQILTALEIVAKRPKSLSSSLEAGV